MFSLRGLLSLALSVYAAPCWASLPSAGETAPFLDFTDLDGIAGSTLVDDSRILVVSFAGKDSSKRLETLMGPADLKAMKQHPAIELTYVNFADLTMVPPILEHVVNPVLRLLNDRVKKTMQESFRVNEVLDTAARAQFHLIPDWAGGYHASFGLENSEQFHCWIIFQNQVIAYLPEGTHDFTDRYLSTLSEIMLQRS